MSTTIDPESFREISHSPAIFGPSDSSDSASDMDGTLLEDTGSDAAGTGERVSVESTAPSETDNDIEPDRVQTLADAASESEGGADTESEAFERLVEAAPDIPQI